jgi:hypothetical protein
LAFFQSNLLKNFSPAGGPKSEDDTAAAAGSAAPESHDEMMGDHHLAGKG